MRVLAVDVGEGEVLGGQCMMWIDSQSTVSHMFSITPAAKCKVACANIGGNRRAARIEFHGAFGRHE